MKRRLRTCLLVIGGLCLALRVHGEAESIDLKALAKKARPAVMLLVVSDANGKEIATGTGFLVSSNGKIITNHHVIEGGASAVAKAENGALFPVEGVLADDPKNDLVLLKINAKDLPFLPLGTDATVEVGTRIAVIGSPLGLEGTLSEGIVSAVRELMGDQRLLQVTAAISPGSSGSPVLNAKGDVIGIASALMRGGQALNFAVPIECANRLMAKVQPPAKPQPLQQAGRTTDDAIYSDPDWRALVAAGALEDYIEVLKRAKVLVSRYPENAVAYTYLGDAYVYLSFTDDAIAAYRQAIKLKPDDAVAWCSLGVAYGKSGRTDDAIAAHQQAIKVKPDYAMGWYNLGVAYDDSGRTDEAVAAYRQAIKLKPDDAFAWCNLGAVYAKSGRTDDATAAFQQAIKVKPDYAMAWSNLGVAYGKSGRADDQIAAHQQAIKVKPDYALGWYNLGVAYGDSGRTNEAVAAFRQAVKLKPDYANAWHNLGVMYRKAGRNAEAADAFQQARQLDQSPFK